MRMNRVGRQVFAVLLAGVCAPVRFARATREQPISIRRENGKLMKDTTEWTMSGGNYVIDESGTYQLDMEIDAGNSYLEIRQGQEGTQPTDVVLELRGYGFTSSRNTAIVVNAGCTLTIEDSCGGGKVRAEGATFENGGTTVDQYVVEVRGGVLNMYGGEISFRPSMQSGNHALLLVPDSTGKNAAKGTISNATIAGEVLVSTIRDVNAAPNPGGGDAGAQLTVRNGNVRATKASGKGATVTVLGGEHGSVSALSDGLVSVSGGVFEQDPRTAADGTSTGGTIAEGKVVLPLTNATYLFGVTDAPTLLALNRSKNSTMGSRPPGPSHHACEQQPKTPAQRAFFRATGLDARGPSV